ncbi:MAG TPA: NAD(P)H-quinone oxidoreductase [Bryobacteraceae bacterium]|nr:NAD(P)H-quinone oxidoreductase [Bryobacteraceae bacterium]
MRVVEIVQPGGPEALRLAERPSPRPGPGEVLIQVKASGINRPDVFQRKGSYPPPPGASDIPGLEVAGVITVGDFSGDNPFGLKPGDAVCALVTGGGYAEYVAAPLVQCLPVPKRLSLEEAASLPETFFTVWSNVFDRGRLSGNESLLVQGGSSGIGVAAIQMAHALGHPVFATAGTDEKCRACEALGARAINYKTEDFVEKVREFSGGRGVDVILDMVAGSYVPRDLGALADDGRLVLISTLGGSKATVDVALVMRRRLTVTGSLLRPRAPVFKGAVARRLHEVIWPLIESGAIRPVIHRIFSAAEAAQAHAVMESGAHIGKLLLRW